MLIRNTTTSTRRGILAVADNKLHTPCLAACVLGVSMFLAAQATAAVVRFDGADNGVGAGGLRPNSDAAALQFQAATSGLSTITFEGLALGTFPVTVAPGVNLTLTNNSTGITTGGNAIIGYNTTSGGSQFLQIAAPAAPATANFAFTTAISAFGGYFTGIGTSTGTVHALFNDGSSQDLLLTGNAAGGIQFFGFADPTNAITTVSIQLQGSPGDVFGIDDVRFGAAATAVPEPGSALAGMLALGACASGLFRRNRREERAASAA